MKNPQDTDDRIDPALKSQIDALQRRIDFLMSIGKGEDAAKIRDQKAKLVERV